ncbi:hypothetical protein CDAR_386101 [Caerostris darwini]|uniref:Uncharacterized protein n=1 Tax=Caerostris darwini TaxID=1538125 RepID=A0AAV4SH15_9ARAC|nr:hypothetical protein CDAR_386101 [Caerostris darwini]
MVSIENVAFTLGPVYRKFQSESIDVWQRGIQFSGRKKEIFGRRGTRSRKAFAISASSQNHYHHIETTTAYQADQKMEPVYDDGV